jgi:tripartite ATP-independent transporter DctP family solute receptor
MKNKLYVIVVLLLSALFLGACGDSANSKPIVLKAADDHELSYPTTQGLVKMGELLAEWTNGRITIQVYPSAQLGSEKETIEQTQMGAIDINRVNINPVTQIVNETKVLALPYIFRNEDHQWKVLNGDIGADLLKKLEPHGLVGLGFYDSGQRSFYNSKRPIRSIEDLKGLKLRVQKAEIVMDMVKAVGANPTPMAFEEVYTGIQTGVIDGAENNEPSYYTKGHYEGAKYYTYDEHSRAPEIILMSKKTWDKLSQQDRDLIMKAAKESIPFQRKLWKEKVDEALEKVKAAGCEIITDIDKEPFIKAMDPVYKKHASDLLTWVDRIRAVN